MREERGRVREEEMRKGVKTGDQEPRVDYQEAKENMGSEWQFP